MHSNLKIQSLRNDSTILAAAHSQGVLYSWLRVRCQRREGDVSSHNPPAQSLRADNSAATFSGEVWGGAGSVVTKEPFQHVWFQQLRTRLLQRTSQTRAKTMPAREKGAADEREGQTQNQFDLSDFSFMEYLQSALPWLFRKRKLDTSERRSRGSVVGEPRKKKQRLDRG